MLVSAYHGAARVGNLDMARAISKLLHLRRLSHENAGLLLVGEGSVTLLAKVLAIHKVDLSLAREADAR